MSRFWALVLDKRGLNDAVCEKAQGVESVVRNLCSTDDVHTAIFLWSAGVLGRTKGAKDARKME
jgi:hypothetical protein